LKLWVGSTVSLFGSSITSLAFPLTAVLLLNATPGQMGTMRAIGSLPSLLITLFAGALADRVRRRPLLIWADLGRAVMIGSIPAAAALGWLRIEQLYVVLFLQNALGTFYDSAYAAFVPALVPRERLVEANGKLTASSSAATIAGPTLAGALVQLLTAPIAITVDALSFVVSALAVWRIRVPELHGAAPPTSISSRRKQTVWRDVVEGASAVWGRPILRAIAVGQCLFSFATTISQTVYVLYVTRELGIAPAVFGTIVGLGSAGNVAAALIVGHFQRWSMGTTMAAAVLVSTVSAFLPPLASSVPAAAVPLLLAAQVLSGIGLVGYMVNMGSLRQSTTPDRLQGRVAATMRFVSRSSVPLAALLGGFLGTHVGLRATLVVGACGMLLGTVWVLLSPISRLPAADDAPADQVATPG
jgi:MFS family permease